MLKKFDGEILNNQNIVEVENVSKYFTVNKQYSLKEKLLNYRQEKKQKVKFTALKDINIEIPIGSTVGLIGHNGSGKSTLLKIIGGILTPNEGEVWRKGRLAALLELGAGFHPDLTGRDNVYLNAAILGMTTAEIDEVFDQIVEFSGIESFINTQVKFYSSGMYVRLAFSVAVHSNPDLLLVDEVLAVGDEPFQQKCMQKIQEFQKEGKTIVLVSHSASQVKQICSSVIVLDQGNIIFQGETKEGLEVLQNSYLTAGRLQENQSAYSNDDRSKPSITSVELITTNTSSNSLLLEDSKLVIDLKYFLPQDIGPLVAGLQIETHEREALYWVDTRMLGIPCPGEKGDHLISFELENNNLGSGTYCVVVKLWTNEGKLLDETSPPVKFSVSEQSVGEGPLRLKMQIKAKF